MKLCLVVLCAWFTCAARAESPSFFLLPALFGEIHVGSTQVIKDQGQWPYCTLYAAASLLEMWGNAKHPNRKKLPNLSTAFLALGYNGEYSDSGNGTEESVLFYTMKKHGIIPAYAWEDTRFSDTTAYLKNGWNQGHSKLIPTDEVVELLKQKYRDGVSEEGVTGREYFASHIGVDLAQLDVTYSQRTETFSQADAYSSEPTGYRINDYVKRREALNSALTAEGFPLNGETAAPDKLYRKISAQLNRSEPVLLSINVHLVEGNFSTFDLITNGDLLKENTSKAGYHSVVAVGICDETKTRIPFCRPFVRQFKDRNVDECLMVQNSWGSDANHRGVFCLSPQAAQRMINSAAIKRPEPVDVALNPALEGKETVTVAGSR